MPRKKKKPQETYGWATGTPHPVDVHVGQRLRLRRKLAGLSQTELGEKIGVTFQQLQKYESGANRISASRLFDLSRVLDVPVSYFFDEMTKNVSEAGKVEAALTDHDGRVADFARFGIAPGTRACFTTRAAIISCGLMREHQASHSLALASAMWPGVASATTLFSCSRPVDCRWPGCRAE